MHAARQLLLTVVLVAVGLWAYDTLRGGDRDPAPPAPETPDLEARLEALDAQLRAIEDRLPPETATPAPAAAAPKTGPLDEAELARLEAVVRELRRREELDRLATSVRARLAALGVGLTEGEQKKAETLLVALEAERADFWRQVRQEGVRDAAQVAERFAPIRARYAAALREAFAQGKAAALIAAYLPDAP